ncbi:hypothetical protein SAMN00777080_2903 [Aquiflexum balticum DSM 16537]|uniref:Cache domain-containing protein n=1 Tax=Aquiflexum balticum DSM 16537 TaxID=758820 RepID=A0A1W2H5T9_9BACT|nr:Cache sensor protein [Aquiflexum balticum]SMD44283.1 hypothetical protein SAMN00777080_2903 [Aquiflexum balticum DSM 16537]
MKFTSLLASSLLFLLAVFVACGPSNSNHYLNNRIELEAIALMMDHDLEVLEDEITKLGEFTTGLFDNKEEVLSKADKNKYVIKGVGANAGILVDTSLSSLYIPEIDQDKQAVDELIYLTNPLDSLFKSIVEKHKVVSQVYFNSSTQLNRLFPPYDVYNMLEPDLDLTTFNFYYEADEKNNPSRGLVWVDEIYIDPVGRGWMISLLNPVYHYDNLKMVLAFDITVNDIFESYIEKSNKELIVVDATGTVVAGKSKAIEVLSLPPLKNYTYKQTITSDSFRMEDFNLFKSKNIEVRKTASNIILAGERESVLNSEGEKIIVISEKLERLNWYILELVL